jgi:hypothetical protein
LFTTNTLKQIIPKEKSKFIKMSSKPKPKLHDDILIMIVEKMFFQKPEGVGNNAIDLSKGNPYTFFMVSFCVIFYIPNINYKMMTI